MNNIKDKGRAVNKSEVEAQFVGKNLTLVGGIGLFYRFVKKLGVEAALEESIELSPQAKVKYKTGRVLISLIYALVLDLDRLSDALLLRLDKVFQKMVNFSGYPHQSTFSRHLQKFTVPLAKKIGEVSVNLMMRARNDLEGYEWITLDFDSYVRTVYGNQQRARIGYNPRKRGRKSFHPLFCFIGVRHGTFSGAGFAPGTDIAGKGLMASYGNALRCCPSG